MNQRALLLLLPTAVAFAQERVLAATVRSAADSASRRSLANGRAPSRGAYGGCASRAGDPICATVSR